MDDCQIYERLTPIFRETFDNDDIVLTETLSARDVAEWDSLSHIRLIVAAEIEFGVSLNASEAAALKNVGEFVAVIARKIAR